MTIFLIISAALIIDRLVGEPKCFHPLVGFGNIANKLETRFNIPTQKPTIRRIMGLLALLVLIFPILIFSIYLTNFGWYFELFILTLGIGWQSLREHGLAVFYALKKNNNALAQQKVGLMVSRDVETLSRNDISKASVESILENGNDAIFSTIFWFLIAGAPGVIVYRLVNTLDAMWGYKNQRFRYFGWSTARLDDLLNYLPARLTALSYVLVGRSLLAIQCWKKQGHRWKSPNAGPVMASGAGSLAVILGGQAMYDGVIQNRPILGAGDPAIPEHIDSSLELISRSIYLWLTTILGIATLAHYDIV